MRILHVTDCFPPRLGGIETQVQGLVREQIIRGYEIHVLTLTPGPMEVGVTRLHPHIDSSVLVRFGCIADVQKTIHFFRPDVIHIHVGSGASLGWAAVKLARQKKMPAILTIHSIWGRVARFIYKSRLSSFPQLDVVNVSRQSQISTGLADSHIIANGLETQGQSSNIPKQNSLTYITASRFVTRKRLLELVEIFARLKSKYPESSLELRIAGDGPLRKRILRKISRHQITNVHLLGRLTQSELHAEYAKANTYIQLSKLEAFGLAAAEAQVHRLGVIGLKESGISDFVEHEVDGYLGADDADIEQFLESTILQPEILRDFSNNVEVNNKPYHWDSVLDRYEALYQRIVGED